MNKKALAKDVGYRVKLVPPAQFLNADNEPLPDRDDDWIIMAVTDTYVEINTAAGYFYRLGQDHIRSFATDPQRSTDGLNHGFLQLNVQLFVRGMDVRAVPNHQPGARVAPPALDLSAKARVTFAPELERIFRRQIQVLDRIIVNFGITSRGQDNRLTGDTWATLMPWKPQFYPTAAAYHDLAVSDAQLLAEFYSAVFEVEDILSHWKGTLDTTEYNAWNVLMHKVQQSVRLGEMAVQKFCPDRPYDATMPAGNNLLFQAQRVLVAAERTRAIFMQSVEAAKATGQQHPVFKPRGTGSTTRTYTETRVATPAETQAAASLFARTVRRAPRS